MIYSSAICNIIGMIPSGTGDLYGDKLFNDHEILSREIILWSIERLVPLCRTFSSASSVQSENWVFIIISRDSAELSYQELSAIFE